MRVFRLPNRRRKRSSSASKEKLHSESMDTSSVTSWDVESSTSITTNSRPLYLITQEGYGTSDSVTDASSLPAEVDDLNDDSPMNWSSSSVPGKQTMMVVFRQPISPRPLPDSFGTWFNAADSLVRSREMQLFVGCSRDLIVSVAMTGGGMVKDAALLPVTLPLHVATSTTSLAMNVAGSVLNRALGSEQSSGEAQGESRNPIDGLIHNVLNFLPFVLDTAGKISNDLGSAAINVVAPAAGNKNGPAEATLRGKLSPIKENYPGQSSSEREEMLNRLRLDIQVPHNRKEATLKDVFTRATSADISKFLLRVDDLKVFVSPNPVAAQHTQPKRALFVDIASEFAEKSLTEDALKQLMQRGLDITNSNVIAHVRLPTEKANPEFDVIWKPERDTGRLMKKFANLNDSEFQEKLRHHVLVWSGVYRGPKHVGSENPLFLARGIVRKSPKEFFNMLWDSDRTSEYNKFSVGRSDTLTIDDSIRNSGESGAKIIKSETRVPFAGLNIEFSALMHGKKLRFGSEDGYAIVSRSLSSGMAGCHVSTTKCFGTKNKNEIILGVNIMRPVPGNPDLCDLISVSQVASSMIPQFLAFRIGMMGLEDFFTNVRK